MELLIIKTGNQYIRVKDDAYEVCGLDKTSVFPVKKLEDVKQHIETLKAKQFSDVLLYKLSIAEEPFNTG